MGAVVEIVSPSGLSRTDFVLLREEGGRYLVEGEAENIAPEATPTP